LKESQGSFYEREEREEASHTTLSFSSRRGSLGLRGEKEIGKKTFVSIEKVK